MNKPGGHPQAPDPPLAGAPKGLRPLWTPPTADFAAAYGAEGQAPDIQCLYGLRHDAPAVPRDGYRRILSHHQMTGYVTLVAFRFPGQAGKLKKLSKLLNICGVLGGMKSVVASEIALGEGFPPQDIYCVVDGYPIWQRRGYPLVSGLEPGR